MSPKKGGRIHTVKVEKFREKRIYNVSAKEIKNLVAPDLGSEWTIDRLEAEGSYRGASVYLIVTLEREVNRTVENGQEG